MTDPNGLPLTAALDSTPAHGTLTFWPNGAFTYVPNAGFFGADQFTYHAGDGVEDSAPVAVTLNVTDAAPVAAAGAYSVHAGSTLTVSPLAFAADADGDPLTVTLGDGPQHGTLTPAWGGSFTYTPDPGFTGQDSFTYQATDGTLASDFATATIGADRQGQFTQVFAVRAFRPIIVPPTACSPCPAAVSPTPRPRPSPAPTPSPSRPATAWPTATRANRDSSQKPLPLGRFGR